MRYKELLSFRVTFLLLFVGLVLAYRFVLSDRVLQLTRRRNLLLPFCLRGNYGCEDVLSKKPCWSTSSRYLRKDRH